MEERIEWSERTDLLQQALTGGGVFLVANSSDGRANPMTIGWAQVGIVWSRPVLTVLVRKSRYTFACLRTSDTFTVSVPRAGEFKDELLFCGTKSGRDVDKVAASGLILSPGRVVDTPTIDGCVLYYEARILARTQQESTDFSARDVLDQHYTDGDHHLVVFGEIVAAYTKGSTV